MADIPAALNKIQQEETQYNASGSEATFTRMGASINYIIDEFERIPVTSLSNTSFFSSNNTGTSSFDLVAPFNLDIKGIIIDTAVFNTGGTPTITATFQKNGTTNIVTGSFTASIPANGTKAFMITNDPDFGGDYNIGWSSVGTLNPSQTLDLGEFLRVTVTFSGVGSGGFNGGALQLLCTKRL